MYSLLLLVNILGLALIVIEHILTGNTSVEGFCGSLSTEFLFLFGIDLLDFSADSEVCKWIEKDFWERRKSVLLVD